jgi:hypothetical protein
VFCDDDVLLGGYIVACLIYASFGRILDDASLSLEEFSWMIDESSTHPLLS